MVDLLEFAERCDTLTRNATPGPWAVCSWLSKGVMPKPWADDELPPQDRGPFATMHCSSGADAALVAAAPEIAATAATIARQLAALLDAMVCPIAVHRTDDAQRDEGEWHVDDGFAVEFFDTWEAALVYAHQCWILHMHRSVIGCDAAAVAQPVTPDPVTPVMAAAGGGER